MMKRIKSIVPQRRSKMWLLWMLAYTIFTTLVLWVSRFALGGNEFSPTFALRFLLLSLVLAAIINGFGWLGARWLWLLTSVGLAAGLAIMAHYSTSDLSGWEDLASFLGFMQAIIIGFGLGVIAEIIALIARWRRRT